MDTFSGQTQDQRIREVLRRCIRVSTKSRETICEELGLKVGRKISRESLNKWAGECESERRLPADCVLALSEVFGTDALQRVMLSEKLLGNLKVGEDVLNSKDMWDALAPVLAKRWVRHLRAARRAIAAQRNKSRR
jgi:hypothetical protein